MLTTPSSAKKFALESLISYQAVARQAKEMSHYGSYRSLLVSGNSPVPACQLNVEDVVQIPRKGLGPTVWMTLLISQLWSHSGLALAGLWAVGRAPAPEGRLSLRLRPSTQSTVWDRSGQQTSSDSLWAPTSPVPCANHWTIDWQLASYKSTIFFFFQRKTICCMQIKLANFDQQQWPAL